MVQAINVAQAEDSDDDFGLLGPTRKAAGKKISKAQFKKEMRRPASAVYDNEAF